MAEPKYSPGDKVLIARKTPGFWNRNGEMDHWLGEVVTIRNCLGPYGHDNEYQIEEDKHEFSGDGWVWLESNFDPVNVEEYDFNESDVLSLLGVM